MSQTFVSTADFLAEIQTEELPPNALFRLGNAFANDIVERLTKAEFSFSHYTFYATPRRLAVLINDLSAKQPDKFIEKKGPALEAAFDPTGNPTAACQGFARSCGVSVAQLTTLKNEMGAWVSFKQHVMGKTATELLPLFTQQALGALPIPKRMRWGDHSVEFVRPVHSVILLYGADVIEADILGCQAGRQTKGHRFMSAGWITIDNPRDYAAVLAKEGFVIADFHQRKDKIRTAALALNPDVLMDEKLLDEVTGLVEWPVAIIGHFDEAFLHVPQEALISAMQDHQRYFPILDKNGKLLPQFIAISNIESKNVQRVIQGNERVLRARLADAAFFFDIDKKTSLEARLPFLKDIIFQAKLGSLFEKSERLAKNAAYIATQMGADTAIAARAGLLAKTDLNSQLVTEFPELQGIAGYYFARNDHENTQLAIALQEHYLPRFSGDKLPQTAIGLALALSDRIDTLVGIFGINQSPTSEKDPFGLRRAALGILRILIEKKLHLDLTQLITFALTSYATPLENKNVVQQVVQFIMERLKPFYQEQGIAPDVFAAVAVLNITEPFDMHRRIQAVQAFKQMADANSLSIANKRVSNILSQYKEPIVLNTIDEKLFEHSAEKILAAKLKEQQATLTHLSNKAQYQELLSQLAELRYPVDDFFDHVMVMTEDKARRENRILLLKQLRELFLNVADIALLQ